MADHDQVARRFELEPADVRESLLDFEAYGWITKVEFADLQAWTLTDAGKAENERQLADELRSTGAGDVLRSVYQEFIVKNDQLLRASTDWQIRPTATDPLAASDHVDRRWDARVLQTLADLDTYLRGCCRTLSAALLRFRGYDQRFSSALARVERGEHDWVNRPRADSCHTVWMELHEDFLATLGCQRADGS
jgi:hypothetical protein